MKSLKRTYEKPELIVVTIDNLISLQVTSEGNTPGGGGLPRSGSQAAPTSSKSVSPNPFDENSFQQLQ